jgi:hypothetical protein
MSRRGRSGRAGCRLSPGQSIVVVSRKVLVPVSLGPLQKFQVILHAALDQRFDRDVTLDAMSGEGVFRKCGLVEIHPIFLNAHGKPCNVGAEVSAKAGRDGIELTLKDLEILYVCVLSIDVELDPAHRYIHWKLKPSVIHS